MSLRAKVLFIVLGVVGLYALLDYASQYFLVLPSFISLERNEAQNFMRRCVVALKREISSLERPLKTWRRQMIHINLRWAEIVTALAPILPSNL